MDDLQTERLVLRKPVESDAAALFAAYTQDKEVARYLTWRPHVSVTETEEFIAGCIRDWHAGLRWPYILVFRDSPIGVLEARPRAHMVDMGYVLARSHWGQGLMPEAIRSLTEAMLARPTFFRVQATCDVDNRPSARALEKSGFIREGRLERYIVHPNVSPDPRPCYLYARCK